MHSLTAVQILILRKQLKINLFIFYKITSIITIKLFKE